MPLYEYQCDDCGHRFETIQKFSDPLVSSCPKCGGRVQKLLSSPAFHLKGSGWYATDYAKKPDGGKSETGSDTSKAGDSKESKESKESKDGSSKEPSSKKESSSSDSSPASGSTSTTKGT